MIDHPAFRPRPDLGQFAKDGQWEAAWPFPASAVPTPERIHAYLAGATEVAFEAFFGSAFFGVRLRGTPQETARLAAACAIALGHAVDGAAFFADLTRSLGLGALGREVTFAEVGAVNAWRSVGAFKIDRLGDASERFDALWQALGASAVGRDVSHRKAIEFACERPVPHWFALPVSQVAPPFALDAVALRDAASLGLHIR